MSTKVIVKYVEKEKQIVPCAGTLSYSFNKQMKYTQTNIRLKINFSEYLFFKFLFI